VSDVADRLYLVGAPWWLQALFLAIIGGGSLYHLASGTTGGTGGSYRPSLGWRLPRWSGEEEGWSRVSTRGRHAPWASVPNDP